MNNEFCLELHKMLSDLPVYTVESLDKIPFVNGIYFVFEKNEEYHGYRRIVRVGTHDANNRLKERLSDHFRSTSKASSIFIKNIGRTYLNMEDKDYIEIWDTKRSKLAEEKKIEYDAKRDISKEKYYEKMASDYIRNNMSVSVIRVEEYSCRDRFEDAIISTLSHTDDFRCSQDWFGLHSPVEIIRNSGMWLTKGLNAKPLTQSEMDTLKTFISSSV